MSDRNAELALNLLRKLIRAKSPNPPGDITKCVQIITQVLDKEGISYEIKQSKEGINNIIAVLTGSLSSEASGTTLLFNGHLDTVPPGEGWVGDPYDAIYRHGYVHGRGSTDMKSGIVASLMALMAIKRAGAKFKGQIIYSAVGDEENHSYYGTKYLLRKGLTADYAVCCEPTDLGLDLGNRGLVMLDLRIKGRSCHAGRPHLGLNAVHIGARIAYAVQQLVFDQFRNEAFEVPVGSCTVVGMEGGAKLNVVPDKCRLHIDRRLMPGESGWTAVNELAKTIEKATGIKPDVSEDSGSQVVMLPEFWHEPCWLSPDHSLSITAYNCIENVLGKPPVVRGKAAGTDASHLSSIGNIPTVIIGPGNYHLSHTSKEKVRFEDVLTACEIYTNLAMEILR